MNVENNILERQFKNINTNDVEIIPCNSGVIFKIYEDNPYKAIETTKSGLIFGVQSTQKYKSNETGEIEENDEYVACAKVIAVGPECKNVKVGEDIFIIKHIAKPLPFRKMGYYEMSEQNILCRIINKNENDG